MARIAFIIEAFAERLAGPKNSVTLLARSLNDNGIIHSEVFSALSDTEFEANSIAIRPVCKLHFSNFDMVVFSGLYNFKYVSIARELRRLGIPYLISPRGSLTVSSLKVSSLKKFAFLSLYGMRFIAGSKGLHFLTNEERENSLNFGAKCYFSSNGVSSVHLNQMVSGFSERRNVILFIGRYDLNHKGLDILLRAISECAQIVRQLNWRLEMYGDDYRGKGLSKVQSLVEKLCISDIVKVGGEVGLEEKVQLLSSSKCFIHTSRFEGQPQAVMEAISHGVPVIVSPGTNMSSAVRQYNLGWAATGKKGSLSSAITNLILQGERDWNAKSENCIAYANVKFNWHEIAKDFEKSVVELILNESAC